VVLHGCSDGGSDIEVQSEVALQWLGEEDDFVADGQFCRDLLSENAIVVGDDGLGWHIECIAGEEASPAEVGQSGVLSGDELFEGATGGTLITPRVDGRLQDTGTTIKHEQLLMWKGVDEVSLLGLEAACPEAVAGTDLLLQFPGCEREQEL
jgi:hypothetical protein